MKSITIAASSLVLLAACSSKEAPKAAPAPAPAAKSMPVESDPSADEAPSGELPPPEYERPDDREDPNEVIAFDLLPCGDAYADLAIQAPRGTKARPLNAECRLSHGEDFRLVIRPGPAGIAGTRDALDADETTNFRALVDSAELLVYETGPSEAPTVRFITQVSVGDRLLTCQDAEGDSKLTPPKVQELARACRSLSRR